MKSSFNFKTAEMKEELTPAKTREVYRVVSVIQPPFMQWNETKGESQACINHIQFGSSVSRDL